MFYSHDLLQFRQGQFWVVWLLGNDFGPASSKALRKLKSTDVEKTSVSKICVAIMEMLPCEGQHISLRTASVLILGAAHCHLRQMKHLLQDVTLYRRPSQRPKIIDYGDPNRGQEMEDPMERIEEGQGRMDLEDSVMAHEDWGRFAVGAEDNLLKEIDPLPPQHEDNGFGAAGIRRLPGLFDEDDFFPDLPTTTRDPDEDREDIVNGTRRREAGPTEVPGAPKRPRSPVPNGNQTEVDEGETRPKKTRSDPPPQFPTIQVQSPTTSEPRQEIDVPDLEPALEPPSPPLELPALEQKQIPQKVPKKRRHNKVTDEVKTKTQEQMIQEAATAGETTDPGLHQCKIVRQIRLNSPSRKLHNSDLHHLYLAGIEEMAEAIFDWPMEVDEPIVEDPERERDGSRHQRSSIVEDRSGLSERGSEAADVRDGAELPDMEELNTILEAPEQQQSRENILTELSPRRSTSYIAPDLEGPEIDLPPLQTDDQPEGPEEKEDSLASSDVVENSELADRIETLTDVGRRSTTFNEVVKDRRRRAVAIAFRRLLDLEANGTVNVEQTEFNGSIRIRFNVE